MLLVCLDEKEGQGSAQTVEPQVPHTDTEEECFLENGARGFAFTRGERCTREAAECDGAGPSRGPSACECDRVGELAPCAREVTARDLDTAVDREGIGLGFFVLTLPCDGDKFVGGALGLI